MNIIETAMARLKQQRDSEFSPDVATPLPMLAEKAGAKLHIANQAKAEFKINLTKLKRLGYLTPDTMQSAFAEEYRLLKRPLLMNANAQIEEEVENKNIIGVTSALPEEGKTFTALNIAMSIAMELNTTALLIDGDLIKHSLSHLIEMDKLPGLIDVLHNPSMDLHHIILNTNIPNLRLIPAGHLATNATELIASQRMQDIVCELSTRYSDRIVIFDTPPLLATSQAVVLAGLMGQILMVVEEGKTQQHSIQEAVSLLDKNKIIGMVLNKCQRRSSDKYYHTYTKV